MNTVSTATLHPTAVDLAAIDEPLTTAEENALLIVSHSNERVARVGSVVSGARAWAPSGAVD